MGGGRGGEVHGHHHPQHSITAAIITFQRCQIPILGFLPLSHVVES